MSLPSKRVRHAPAHLADYNHPLGTRSPPQEMGGRQPGSAPHNSKPQRSRSSSAKHPAASGPLNDKGKRRASSSPPHSPPTPDFTAALSLLLSRKGTGPKKPRSGAPGSQLPRRIPAPAAQPSAATHSSMSSTAPPAPLVEPRCPCGAPPDPQVAPPQHALILSSGNSQVAASHTTSTLRPPCVPTEQQVKDSHKFKPKGKTFAWQQDQFNLCCCSELAWAKTYVPQAHTHRRCLSSVLLIAQVEGPSLWKLKAAFQHQDPSFATFFPHF